MWTPLMRGQLTDVQNLWIDTPTAACPVKDVADVRIAGFERHCTGRPIPQDRCFANVKDRDLGSVAEDEAAVRILSSH
jgi:Cu/Ag efflux pump CusA